MNNSKRRIAHILMAILMIVVTTTVGMTAFADVIDAEPIKTLEELQNIELNGTYKLANDIVIKSTDTFTPIGSEDEPFTGTIYGDGNAIRGLSISGNTNVGLLAVIGEEGVVDGLDVSVREISGSENVGVIAGTNKGTIIGCDIVVGNVKAEKNAGGVAGVNMGTISGTRTMLDLVKAGTNAGGIVGLNVEGNIYGCAAMSNVNADINAGGIAGMSVQKELVTDERTNMQNQALVVVKNHIHNSYVRNCEITGDSNIGGIIGNLDAELYNGEMIYRPWNEPDDYTQNAMYSAAVYAIIVEDVEISENASYGVGTGGTAYSTYNKDYGNGIGTQSQILPHNCNATYLVVDTYDDFKDISDASDELTKGISSTQWKDMFYKGIYPGFDLPLGSATYDSNFKSSDRNPNGADLWSDEGELKAFSSANKCVHSTVEIEAVAATCEGNAWTSGAKCEICETEFIAPEEIADSATGHDYQLVRTDAASCTQDGTEYYICANNADHTKTETITATGHTVVTDAAVEPTCEGTGLTEGSHCSVCDKVLVEQKEIPATGHTEVTDAAVEPTCEDTGLTEGSHCSVCDKVLVEQKEIPANGHTVVTDVAVEATCEDTGLTEGSHCEVCGEVLAEQEEIPAKGHTEVIDSAVDATCEDTGLTEGSHCEVCGETLTKQEVVDALGHAYEGVVTTEPTCEKDGVKTYTCANDPTHTYTETVDATGHAYGEWEVVTPASCSEVGQEKRVCANDASHVETREIEKTAHTVVIDPAVEPTCTETGLTEGSHCEVCGEPLTKQEVVDALGHAYEGVVTTEPTCTEAGEKTFTCANDPTHTYTETIDALGHDYKLNRTDDATCTENGTKYYVCANDESHTKTESIPATGHTWSEWEVAEEATCDKEGLNQRECAACGEVETEVIPMKDHTDWDGDHKCDDCGEYTDNHKHVDNNGDDICDGCGTQLFRCKWCIKYEFKKGTALEPIYYMIHVIVHFFSRIFGKGWYI